MEPAVDRLANGLTVSMECLPYLHSASAGIWIKAGSVNETPREAGLAHLLEHLFFKGTKTRSVRQIMEAIEGCGGQMNGFTTREYTCLYVKMLDRHLATGIEILADLVKNSLFCDLEKERNVVLEEIASIEDTPDEYIHDLLALHHWPNHSLGVPVSGYHDSVAALSLEDVRAFHQRWHKPENMFFSVAGNIDQDAVLAQIHREFEDLTSGAPALENGSPRFQGGVKTVDRDIGQAHLCVAFPGPLITQQERYVCDLISSVLGGGSTSRLFDRIREQEGLAYAIHTFHSFHLVAGTIGIYAAVAPQNYGRTLDLIFEELRRIRDVPVSPEELNMNREQIKGNILMSLESTFTRMSRMAKCLMYYGRIVPIDEVTRQVDAITAEELQAFAQKTFSPDCCAVVTLGPTNGHRIDRIPL